MSGTIAQTCIARGYDVNGNQLFVNKGLTESVLNITAEELLIRLGQNNSIGGIMYFNGDLSATLSTPIIDLSYFAMKFGGLVEGGSDLVKTESITVETVNKITVPNDVVSFYGDGKLIGWYKHETEDESKFKLIEFTEKTATVSGLAVGDKVCVRYPRRVIGAEQFTLGASFFPQTIRLELDVPEIRLSVGDSKVGGNEIGKYTISIPQFMLNPTNDLSMTTGSNSATSLGGRALVNYGGGCESSDGYLAVIKHETYDTDEFDDVKALIVANGATSLVVNETEKLQIVKYYNNPMKAPSLVEDYSKLTFAVDTDSVASISEAGVVTALSAGTTTFDVTVTDKTSISGVDKITVTAS